MNQYKFKYQTVFSARLDKQDEDNQIINETELFNNLFINHNLRERDLVKIDIKSPLEYQIQQQEEMKGFGWRFDNKNSKTVSFFKTGETNRRSYVTSPLRSNAILGFENNDNYCFL